jgi:hypothetical protein
MAAVPPEPAPFVALPPVAELPAPGKAPPEPVGSEGVSTPEQAAIQRSASVESATREAERQCMAVRITLECVVRRSNTGNLRAHQRRASWMLALSKTLSFTAMDLQLRYDIAAARRAAAMGARCEK